DYTRQQQSCIYFRYDERRDGTRVLGRYRTTTDRFFSDTGQALPEIIRRPEAFVEDSWLMLDNALREGETDALRRALKAAKYRDNVNTWLVNGLQRSYGIESLPGIASSPATAEQMDLLMRIKREGIDLFVALDVSLSMKAEDIKPNRLDKAKRDVSNLLRKLAGDRVGLIVFAGDAFVHFPLTADYSAADLFISAVAVESVPRPGTMIGNAIEKALDSFKAEDPTEKAIIIASDGENNEGEIKRAVEKALEAGVKIYTIGTGTPEGGPIPIYNAAGVRTDFKRDMVGNVVLTRLDETTLEQIATATGGSYRRATSGGDEIEEVFQELTELEKTEFGAKQITGYESLYQYPLALALLLMLMEFLSSERRGKVIAKLKELIPIAGTAVFLLMLAASGQALGQTVRSHVAEGNEAYVEEHHPDAEAEYKKALEKDASSREAHFNLGDAYYK
ncbi:MAG: VWA domain-containing protein, partial [Proteobacteria bacterium]|nr:VWA domain-containing protein [Pseudomonadota bacterium]